MSNRVSTPTLGAGQGFIAGEHSIPPDCMVMELKQCENCPATFIRKKGSGGVKYCGRCRANYLLPVILDDYKAMLPAEVEMKHSQYLPHYDNSLLSKEQRRIFTHQPGIPTKRRQYNRAPGDLPSRIEAAFDRRQVMSAEEIRELTRWSMKPSQAISRLRCKFNMQLDIVGSVWPRPSVMGRCPKLFRLAKETL